MSVSLSVMTNTTPAGWYDDGHDKLRFWDGAAWTEQVKDLPSTEPALEPGVLWAANGKPLKGFGGGRYKLTDEYLFFEVGTISTKAQQILTREIHDVDFSQSLTQKARSLGTITLHARRTGGDELVVLEDIPNFREGVTLMNEVAHRAREDWRVKQSTSNVNYTGSPAQAAPAAPAAPASAEPDLNTELAKLATFHQQGILDDAEFTAAKKKLLGL